ncbi:MAG: NYN domain-containing protein [Parcubacteria group bacterium]|nr:NYN domain-containing protein [Parcubacteria group bacterium]MBI3075158.1 NYN domain-containing protein [Parcubacteria group bacterium]
MKKQENNFAYIDGANLHKGINELGWALDYKKFRVWLCEKFGVAKAYIFLGFIPTNAGLYRDLQNFGYTIVFKPTVPDGRGSIKGNCDAEMVLQAVSDMYEKQYENAVLVTGDGDFACLVNFLNDKKKLKAILSPNHRKASVLLRKAAPHQMFFLERFRHFIDFIEYAKNEHSN